jgi:hypothetical protein
MLQKQFWEKAAYPKAAFPTLYSAPHYDHFSRVTTFRPMLMKEKYYNFPSKNTTKAWLKCDAGFKISNPLTSNNHPSFLRC